MLTQRLAGVVLILCLLPACAGLQGARSVPQSTNERLETTSHSTLESTTANTAFRNDSLLNAQDEIGTGPKTERVVGMVAVATFFAVLTGFIVVVYDVVKLLSN